MAFDTTAPKRDDSYNNSLFKLAQYYHAVCPASDSQPLLRDSDQVLLIKILRAVNSCGPFSQNN